MMALYHVMAGGLAFLVLFVLVTSLACNVVAVEDVLTNLGREGVTITALVIDPLTSATLYAGTAFGVFKSTDGGETWNAGSSNQYIYALAINQDTPSIIFAGTLGRLGGVLKSTDGGASWTPVNNGLPGNDVFALAIDPALPATVYAGTQSRGVFKSTDGGESWNAANTGLAAAVFTP